MDVRGTRVGVQHLTASRTRLAWVLSTPVGAFNVAVAIPQPPLQAVQVLVSSDSWPCDIECMQLRRIRNFWGSFDKDFRQSSCWRGSSLTSVKWAS